MPASDFTPIGSSGFQGAQADVELGSHTITGNGQPFGAFVYGFDTDDSYGYAGGLSLAPIARVAKIELAPATATHLVDTRQCVTATVTDSSSGRVPGVRVDFAASGANTAIDSVIADGQGEAQFCYTGTKVGDDAITGSVGSVSGTAAKSWVVTLPVAPGQAVEAVATKAALACTRRNIALIEVLGRSGRVTLLGAADPSLSGQRVDIVFTATKKTVAHATVGADGSFRTTAAIPARSIRSTNRARYKAVVGNEASTELKLTRRLLVTSSSSSGGMVTIRGRVVAPLGQPIQPITVTERVTCTTKKVVKTFAPSASGRFAVTFPAPSGTAAAVYVLNSRVRKTAGNTKLFPTKSLPRPVAINR